MRNIVCVCVYLKIVTTVILMLSVYIYFCYVILVHTSIFGEQWLQNERFIFGMFAFLYFHSVCLLIFQACVKSIGMKIYMSTYDAIRNSKCLASVPFRFVPFGKRKKKNCWGAFKHIIHFMESSIFPRISFNLVPSGECPISWKFFQQTYLRFTYFGLSNARSSHEKQNPMRDKAMIAIRTVAC